MRMIIFVRKPCPHPNQIDGILKNGTKPYYGRQYFDPSRIELLATVANPRFTRTVEAALPGFRDLACFTGGWHNDQPNPAIEKYNLPNLNNDKRRLYIEKAPDPYLRMRVALDDIVRFTIAKSADILPCSNTTHSKNIRPECFDIEGGLGGVYRKIHSEQQLRQILLPSTMSLVEKLLRRKCMKACPIINWSIKTAIPLCLKQFC